MKQVSSRKIIFYFFIIVFLHFSSTGCSSKTSYYYVSDKESELVKDLVLPLINEINDPNYDFEKSGDYEKLKQKYQGSKKSTLKDEYVKFEEGESSESVKEKLGEPRNIEKLKNNISIWEYDFFKIEFFKNKLKKVIYFE